MYACICAWCACVCAPDPGGRGWTASMCTPALEGKGKRRQPGGGTLGRRESKVGSARLTPTQGRKRKSFISFPGALHSHRHTRSLDTCSESKDGKVFPALHPMALGGRAGLGQEVSDWPSCFGKLLVQRAPRLAELAGAVRQRGAPHLPGPRPRPPERQRTRSGGFGGRATSHFRSQEA